MNKAAVVSPINSKKMTFNSSGYKVEIINNLTFFHVVDKKQNKTVNLKILM